MYQPDTLAFSTANNQVLHSPVNRINILARHAASALLTSDTPTIFTVVRPQRDTSLAAQSFTARLRFWLSTRAAYLTFRTTLLLLDVAFVGSAAVRSVAWTWHVVRSALLHGPRSGEVRAKWNQKSGGFEDDLEQGMRRMAKDEFGVDLDESAFMG